jgi:bifunctional non-homologous end joining protein LigD
LRAKTAPLKDETAVAKGAKWVEPRLVAEIEFRGRTGGGLIRHATFREVVENADPAKVVRRGLAPAKQPAVDAPQPARLTNPGRLLWPEQGITKQGLADFYTEIANWILPQIAGRPLSLVRCPGGVQEQCFFQKHKWAGLGDAVRLVPIPGEDEPMLAIDDLAGLLELVQASVLEIHPWGSKAERPDLPDRVTIDLDPADDVPWDQVIEAAIDVRTRLSALGLQSFVKTTGGKGLHVVFPLVPKADWDTVKSFAQSISAQMEADQPRRYTANMAKRNRQGRIYVDYLRNGMGATAVAAYSTRARPGAAVSTPIAWDELVPGIRSNHFTVENLPKRLPFLDRDPWEGIASLRQELPGTQRAAQRSPRESRSKSEQSRGAAPENIQQLLPDAVAPSKNELAAYWKRVATDALPYLGRRPLRLVRHVDGKTFYHQGSLLPVPDAVHQLRIEKREGGEGVRLWVDSLEGLLGLLEIDVVELHPWGSTIDDIERPDGLAFALDPGEGVDWKFVIETALKMRDLLRAEGLDSWPKLTGDASLHVMVPIEPELSWQEAERYAEEIARRLPGAGIDCRYNRRGTPAIAAFSPRMLPGFPTAAPVEWAELAKGNASNLKFHT